MKVSERNIEMNVVRHARLTGWWTAKFSSPAKAHVPDRIFIRNGVVIFIEFKATGAVARPAQLARIKEMRNKGAVVFIIDNMDEGYGVLDSY